MRFTVAFKTATPSTLGLLITSIRALKDNCLHPRTGKPYILDLRGGKQISTEGLDRGMQVVFVMEFEVSHHGILMKLSGNSSCTVLWLMRLVVRRMMTTSSTIFTKIPLMSSLKWVACISSQAICSLGFCVQKSAKGEWEAIDVVALDFNNGKF